jgi:hypothetical protein
MTILFPKKKTCSYFSIKIKAKENLCMYHSNTPWKRMGEEVKLHPYIPSAPGWI